MSCLSLVYFSMELILRILQGAIDGELQGVAHMVLDSTGIKGSAIEVRL